MTRKPGNNRAGRKWLAADVAWPKQHRNGPGRSSWRTGGSNRVKPSAPGVSQTALARSLRKTAVGMLPFYRTVAASERYATQWSDAVVDLDLDRMERLLRQASPRIGPFGLGTSSIGYVVELPVPEPVRFYTNGTTIIPGTAQFVFEPRAHRVLSAAVLPFYRSLAGNPSYTQTLADAIVRRDSRAVAALVRSRVRSRTLQSVQVEGQGVALRFRFSFSTYTYSNLLLRQDGV